MEDDFLQVVRRVEREDSENREKTADMPHARLLDRPETKMLALHPDTARLAHIVVQSIKARNLVEVGVSHGYSTVWLAHAARITGGRLTALENNPRSIDIGHKNLSKAGLSDTVSFVLGDALETLKDIQGPVDFVLLDLWDDLYVGCLKLIVPLLRPGGLLFADNITPGNPDSDKYVGALKGYPQLETVFVPVGRGLYLTTKALRPDKG